MENNYGEFSKEVLEENFELAKADILESFGDIIKQNKEDIMKELKEELDD